VDDLQSIANDYLKLRQEEIARCEAIIAEKVKPLLETNTFQPQIFTDEHRFKTLSADA
jgi:glutamyl-tRNA reductase